jgi:vacuolar protein sorting-associated protein 18
MKIAKYLFNYTNP